MNAARRNAKRLAEDAAMLFEHGRMPSAACLAILSIEESGKISVLRSLALCKSERQIKGAWKDFRTHTRKNAAWLLPELAAMGARKLDDFLPLFDPRSEHPLILDQLKQIGFYVDYFDEAYLSRPEDVIDKGLTGALVKLAQVLAKDREFSEREIKLWIEHLGPVWPDRHPQWQRQALINWFAAMQAEGLIPPGGNSMEQFIRSGIVAEPKLSSS